MRSRELTARIGDFMRDRLLNHFREYGLEHFCDEAVYDTWLREKLGRRLEKINRMRNRFPMEGPGDPGETRGFFDYISDPRTYGPLSSGQADDLAQAALAITNAIEGRARVLEVGCAVGMMSTWFARADAERSVVGIDFAGACVVRARRKASALRVPNVSFEVGDVTRNLPEGPFDAIVDAATLYLVSDLESALQHVAKRLTSDGILVTVPQLGRTPLIEEYARALERAGFVVRAFDYLFANDLGKAVARPLIVAGFDDPTDYDVPAAHAEVVEILKTESIETLWSGSAPKTATAGEF
jgi:2-polyprenyl-3-methyl-5-hydroxy-6-metoxy-1,4-benzoquinol methylase